jgi:hypothetical protein
MAQLTALLRSHRRVAEATVAVIALAGGVGIGFGISDLGGSTSPVVDSMPTPPTNAPAVAPQGKGEAKAQGIRGQITAENGSTWTVLSRVGETVTVDITPSTQFGTRAQPASASQFVTGSRVAAIGTRSGTTVTATRVVVPKPAANPGGAGPPTTTPPTTTAPSTSPSA